MARSTRSTDARSNDKRVDDARGRAGDPAPQDDVVNGTRADYAPTGADPKPTTGGTLKRTLKEFSEDNLTDWAAALTYYGVLALFPALLAMLSLIGLLVDPATLTDALTAVVPGAAAETLQPVVDQIAPARPMTRPIPAVLWLPATCSMTGPSVLAALAGTTVVSASVSCCGVVSSPTMEASAISAGNSARTP